MENNHSDKVKSIFLAATERGGPQRAAYLDGACGGDAELRGRVDELLRAHEEMGSFHEQPAAGVPTANFVPIAEGAGTTIGRYKLLQKIGEGGFGVVFMAEQREPVVRKVALKIIKPGMDSKEVIARFEAERQALALMDHPNIARVLDAGSTDSGRPYFVMELVKGVPVTDYCDRNELPAAERLKLFSTICRAVQHAHQKGIIHRDLKPSNILVTLHDGKPVPKVIDFGVSKAISQRLTEKTLFTAYGQMIGTPQYMSPEQAEMSGLDVDTRSDVYSLGVLLYELLTGTTPLEGERLRTVGYAEMQRIIREEDPPRPSLRVSALGEQLTAVAKHRSTDAKQLQQTMRGELDWIVMKSLEKERGRRYESPNSMAEDLERFLCGQPVEAHPPSAAYRLRKFIRRNRFAVAAALAVSLALLAGITGTTTGWITATEQRDRAIQAEQVTGKALEAAQTEKDRAEGEAEQRRRLLYDSDMNVAGEAWDENDVNRALDLLRRHIPRTNEKDLRGFEWYYLWRLCQRSLSAPRIELPKKVNAVAFSPDSGTLAVEHFDHVTLFDARTRRELETFVAGSNQFYEFVAFSPDGNTLAFPSQDGTGIILRDLKSRREQQLVGHKQRVRWVAFFPDGKLLASGGLDKKVIIWDVMTGSQRRILDAPASVWSVAVSKDGRLVAAGTDEGGLMLWDLDGGDTPRSFMTSPVRALPPGASGSQYVWSVAFSPDGTSVAAGCGDTTVRVWELSSNRERIVSGHLDEVRTIAFSPDGETLVSGSRDGSVRIWDWPSLSLRETLKGHSGAVHGVAFSPKGDVLASGSTDYGVKFWNMQEKREVQALYCSREVDGLALSTDGRILVARLGKGGKLDLWRLNAAKGHEVPLTLMPSGALGFAISAKGVLAAGSETGELRLWNPSDSTESSTLSVPTPEKVHAIAFSPDGDALATASGKGDVWLWNAKEHSLVFSFPKQKGLITYLAFVGPDGKTLALGSADGSLGLWDVGSEKPRLMRTLTGHGRCLALSPDGYTLVASDSESVLKLSDVLNPQSEPKTLRLLGGVTSVAFSPDGGTLFTAGIDRVVRLWDTATGQQRFTLHHPSSVDSMTLSVDGDLVVSGERDGTVRLWRRATEEEVRSAEW